MKLARLGRGAERAAASSDSTATHGFGCSNLPDSAQLAPNGRGFDSRRLHHFYNKINYLVYLVATPADPSFGEEWLDLRTTTRSNYFFAGVACMLPSAPSNPSDAVMSGASAHIQISPDRSEGGRSVAGSPRTRRFQIVLSALVAHRAMSSLLGRVLSTTLSAVSAPATGRCCGSCRPICTSTDAWSQ